MKRIIIESLDYSMLGWIYKTLLKDLDKYNVVVRMEEYFE